MSSRHLVAATQPEPEQAPLAALPAVYADLTKAVRERRSSGVDAAFGASIPIRLDVMALLYSSDHLGRMGIVPGLRAMERVTRLALGDSAPGSDVEAMAVRRACHYLTVQLGRLLQLGCWSTAATHELVGDEHGSILDPVTGNRRPSIVDEVLSRVDPHAVRRDFEQAVHRAAARVVELDATVPRDQLHLEQLEAQRAACEAMVAMDYIDYEGQLYDAITERYRGAATDAYEWYGFVAAETAWMVAQGESLLGLAEHSRRRLAMCPLDCGGQIGLSADPNVADCDVCAWTSPLDDGQADAWFAAFRSGGWVPVRVA